LKVKNSWFIKHGKTTKYNHILPGPPLKLLIFKNKTKLDNEHLL